MPNKKVKGKKPKSQANGAKGRLKKLMTRRRDFLNRRPHRSFQLTRRRDYKRDFAMPGYFSFSTQVLGVIWQNRRLFSKFLIVYVIISALLLGIISQGSYSQLAEQLKSLGENLSGSDVGLGSRTLALFSAVVSGSLGQPPSQAQQIYAGLLFLLSWLTVVWLLRHVLSGRKVRLRDGIYSSAAPLVATFLVLLIVLVQLLPLALAAIAYGAATAAGLLNGGVESMLAWIGIVLLGTLSLYWLTSSLIALVIITLPGMYPFAAIKSAGDLVLGRRLRVMLRIVWLALSLVILWIFALVPAILLSEIVNVSWLPIVPVVVLLLSSLTVLSAASYIYLLYRRLIDDSPTAA